MATIELSVTDFNAVEVSKCPTFEVSAFALLLLYCFYVILICSFVIHRKYISFCCLIVLNSIYIQEIKAAVGLAESKRMSIDLFRYLCL